MSNIILCILLVDINLMSKIFVNLFDLISNWPIYVILQEQKKAESEHMRQ